MTRIEDHPSVLSMLQALASDPHAISSGAAAGFAERAIQLIEALLADNARTSASYDALHAAQSRLEERLREARATRMTNEDILDISRRAFVEAAQIASDMAEQNRAQAVKLHQRAAKQARLYSEDVADNTKISAQVLDACAEEARCIAERILARAPQATRLKAPLSSESTTASKDVREKD